VKYWEVIADKLSAADWSWGYCGAVTKGCWRWIVDAHREGRRYIVHSEELLSWPLGLLFTASGYPASAAFSIAKAWQLAVNTQPSASLIAASIRVLHYF